VTARTHWLAGLVALVLGDLDGGLRGYEAGLALYRRLGEREYETFLTGLRAEAHELAGEMDLAWSARSEGLRALAEISSARRRHSMLIGGAVLALRRSLPEVAANYSNAALENAVLSRNPGLLAEAHLYLARARSDMSDARNAVLALEAAQRHASQAPSGVRERLLAEVLLGRAQALDSAESAALADEARTFFEERGATVRLPSIEHARARAALRAGDIEGARAAFGQALELVLGLRQALREQRRVSYADEYWPLVDEAIDLELSHGGGPAAAFALADRFGLLGDPDAATGQVSRDPGSLTLRFLTLPSRILVSASSSARQEFRILQTNRPTIAKQVADLQRLAQRATTKADTARLRDLSTQLHDTLIAPFRRRLDGKRLYLALDGPLHQLPFGVLLDRASHKYLVQEYDIAVIVGARPPRLDSAPPADYRHARALLVDAAPAGGARSSALPEATAEVRTVSALFPRATVLRGEQATPSRFLELAPISRILHFAGHARANPLYPANGWLDFGTGTRASRVYAHQIETLRLERDALVVLSACGTGRGRISRTEGPLSLARSFLKAGSAAVIATRWDVDDRGARTLTTSFYNHLVAGSDPIEALARAQRDAIAGDDQVAPGWAAYTIYTDDYWPDVDGTRRTVER
jgi:CHAT domain-containing protein